MKKYVLGILICMLSFVMVLSGCGTTVLTNCPTNTSNMQILGDVLVYENYTYFANAYIDNASLSGNDNDVGNVDIESLYRVATNNSAITYDSETGFPENVEKVLSKVVGSNNSFIYSIGEYIYFASPSTHKDINSEDTFTLNSYFRVKTDGTGLKEFYTSNNAITSQTILQIGTDYYLIMIDGSDLIKIKLGATMSAVTLVSDFKSAIFANTYNVTNDKYAYFTVEETTDSTVTGTYLKKVDILTGEITQISEAGPNDKTITLDSVLNGVLYFKMNESDSKTYNLKYETGNFSTRIKISAPLDSITVDDFNVLNRIDSTTQVATTYYLFTISSKVYCLQSGDIEFNTSKILIDKDVTVLFTSGDYVYYSVDDTGIYRISILDKVEQQISDVTSFMTTKITFDGRFVYFYALNTDNTSGTYYMHRADTRNAELNQECNVELLGTLLESDQPTDEDE